MLWPALLAVFLVLVVVYILCDTHPLDVLPGHPRIPIFGCAFSFLFLSPRALFLTMRQSAKEYGDRYLIKIFRRRILHLHHPNDVELVLTHSKNIGKSRPYLFLTPWLGTGLLISTGKKWFTRRKVLTPTFHFNILKNFTTIIEEKSRDLVTRLKKHQEIEHDLYPIISDFTLYTICETAMGTKLDQDTSAGTVEYKAAILDIGNILLTRLTRFWLHSDFVFKKLEIGRNFEKILNTVHSFADNVILERKQKITTVDTTEEEEFGSKKRLAMLDLLLEAESRGEIDLEGIREEVNTFMFEGHDTTATALTFGLMLLADHEEVQERVYEECQQIFGDSDRTPNMADLGEMKYLEAVIKEVLRLYPSVPFIARVVTEDFMLGDLQVPKGIEVAVHIYDLHHRQDLYPDPEAFKPERFLDGTQRHTYAYVPFSAGPRNCIGQRFAMLEMKCVLSEIVRNFKLEPKMKGWRPALVADMVLRSTDRIHVKFTRRQS